jgi:hypothetical protein
MIRHRMTSNLPDVVWYFDDGDRIEAWWREIGATWRVKTEQLEAVAQHYRDASPEERLSMVGWLALASDDRPAHPWAVTLARIEQRYRTDAVALPKAWRAWTAREYIQSCNEFRSDDMVGDVIAACVADDQIFTRKSSSVGSRRGGK